MTYHESAAIEPTLPDPPYYEEPQSLGQHLREARLAHGWDCDAVAAQLKLPTHVIRRIESDDLAAVGHGLYLRSYLTRYADLLGVDRAVLEPILSREERTVPLVATGVTSRTRRLFDRYSVSATYLVLTALIVAPAVWLAANGGIEQVTRTALLDDVALSAVEPADRGTRGDPLPDSQWLAQSPAPVEPLIASMAPFGVAAHVVPPLAPVSSGVSPDVPLSLELSEDSWVEIAAADGSQLEYGLLRAGSRHEYRGEQPLSVRIGNVAGVRILMHGKPADPVAFQRGNVAHFSASPDRGELTAARH